MRELARSRVSQILCLGHLMAEPDYLVQQLRICRKGHILLLYGRIDEGCLIGISLAASIVLAVLLVLFLLLPILQNKVEADTFFQDKLYALLSDTMSEFTSSVGAHGALIEKESMPQKYWS